MALQCQFTFGDGNLQPVAIEMQPPGELPDIKDLEDESHAILLSDGWRQCGGD